MTSNKYTGDVALRLPGWPEFILNIDHRAIGAIQSAFPDKALSILVKNDINALLELTVIALRHHHPEVTVADLEVLPPSVAQLTARVGEALALAYQGPGSADQESGAANPQNRAARRAAGRKSPKTRSKRR